MTTGHRIVILFFPKYSCYHCGPMQPSVFGKYEWFTLYEWRAQHNGYMTTQVKYK